MAKTSPRTVARDPSSWTLKPVARRREAAPDAALARLDPQRIELVETLDATPRRTARSASLELSVAAQPGERLVLMARHRSGAVTFHAPEGTRRRADFTVATTLAKVVRVFVLRVIAPLAELAIGKLARTWEASAWRSSGRAEGWVRVLGDDEASFALERVAPDSAELESGPCLLLLHGTFSDTAGSFRALARSGFLRQARARYGARVFAFEHFSVSRAPQENLRTLLRALPDGRHTFDLIGFSRGALLCRLLMEQPAYARLVVRRAVLIEGPLRGTTLARPARYAELLGWIANLLEVFPEHPLTTAGAWLTDAVIWLAYRLTGALPGIAAMDPDGRELVALRDAVAAADPRWFAIGADFRPDAGLRARLLDVGADRFFAEANDLVVPSAGCYTPGRDATSAVPVSRRLVFAGDVHHLNAVGQAQTARFAADALLAPEVRRGRGAAPAAMPDGAAPVAALALAVPVLAPDPVFHILVLSNDDAKKPRPSRVIATWNGARVQERFVWSDRESPGAGTRWNQIIRMHRRLLAYFSGEPDATLPDEDALREFGRALFEALMFGQVGRLYDEARGQVGGARLVVVLTSESGRWAEKPWEFAFDPARRTWLATDDVHLIRDVLGAIPTDVLPAHDAPLRLLVAYAQPIEASALSVEDERKLILRAFQPLIDAGLAIVEVLARATPARLQAELEAARYDALHFVGHGMFDAKAQRGTLLFEDERHHALLISDRQFRQIVANRGLRMVFLNACETGRSGYVDFNRGVAPTLLSAGLPAVVANQFSVFDTAAVSFAQNLYARLALGRTLSEAMREARIALNTSLDGTNIDWAVPVLFTRVPQLRLCTPSAAPRVVLPETAAIAPRAKVRPYRVGVWDVSRRFPELEALLRRLNQAQGELEFVPIDVSVPLAASGVSGKGTDARGRYLDAQVARSRLRRVPFELGVDLLVGFTHQWMMDDRTRDVFAVWGDGPHDPANPVALLSVAGFDVPARGAKADAFLINGLVGSVAGVLCQLDSHGDGEKRCPLYYNARRSVALLTGRQRFDPRVRRAIGKQSPALLAALDAVLAENPGSA